MAPGKHWIFRIGWWGVNLLLAVSVGLLLYSGCWEYSVRQYLGGFSAAIVPAMATPQQQVEAILNWMSYGPPRPLASNPDELSARDPETTLNYRQLLSVCGTATNAFLNLSRSAGLNARRLLLLAPDRTTKHVVAEVAIDGRWVIVDPAYHVMLHDERGRLLTSRELQSPAIFAQATGTVANYPPQYDYASFAHVRLARLPLDGFHLRGLLDAVLPNWDERLDWSLLLERESFFALVGSAGLAFVLLGLRFWFAWYADYRFGIPRFHLREHFLRAGTAFFSTPGIK
jgi:Transglutaminase-like superfamily